VFHVKRLLIIAIFGIFVTLSIAPYVSGNGPTTRIVDDDDATHQWSGYTEIQDAVNASLYGDIILVYNGTYYETVVVNETVDIVGNGSSVTIVDAVSGGDVITVVNDYVNISGLNVTGTGFAWGFEVTADDVNIDNCTMYDNGGAGVYATSAYRLTVDNCTFADNGRNMWVTVNHMTVKWCTFSGSNYQGVLMQNPTYNSFINCTFLDESIAINGAAVTSWDTHTFDNCTVNGDPIRYHHDQDDFTVVGGAGQVILGDCRDVRIENMTFSGGSVAITMGHTDRVRVANCTISDQYDGIYAVNCDDNVIIDTMVSDWVNNGIRISGSGNEMLNVTLFNSSADAIRLGYNDNNVRNCTIYNVRTGILSSQTGGVIENLTSYNCTTGINHYGDEMLIQYCNLYDLDVGFDIGGTNNTVQNCSVHDSDTGFDLGSCDWATIIYNEIFDNTGYGVYLASTVNNVTVHHNNIANNGGTSSQGYDDGANNVWDDGAEGNWWDDWGGSGNYTIDGSANMADEYPLDNRTATSAPEKVPEFGPLVALSMVLVFAFAIRRRPR